MYKINALMANQNAEVILDYLMEKNLPTVNMITRIPYHRFASP